MQASIDLLIRNTQQKGIFSRVFLANTSADQAEQPAAAVVGAMRLPSGWCSKFQPHFLSLIFRELLEVEIDFQRIPGLSVAEAGVIFPDPLQRQELIELLVLTEMMVNPSRAGAVVGTLGRCAQCPRQIPCISKRSSNPSQGTSSE